MRRLRNRSSRKSSWTRKLGVVGEKYSVLAYVTNVFDHDEVQSAQGYGDPFIATPVALPVLADTTDPADPRQFGRRVNFRF